MCLDYHLRVFPIEEGCCRTSFSCLRIKHNFFRFRSKYNHNTSLDITYITLCDFENFQLLTQFLKSY